MKLLKSGLNIDFMRRMRLAALLSGVVVTASLLSLWGRGLNLGVDFTGGTLVELSYEGPAPLDDLRGILDGSEFRSAAVQQFGTPQDVLIRIAPRQGLDSAAISNQILDLLRDNNHQVSLRRAEFVGPQVGKELTEDGVLALIYALCGILVYVTLRFQSRFALGAVVALLHDVIVTVGFFSLTGIEFDLSVLAAILAVIGYSLNDTIVIYDRIRENFQSLRKRSPFEIINVSLNQTLNRTIMTSLTTMMVLLALLFLGGEIIRGFAGALIIGVLIGTYSSLFVASPVLLATGITEKHLQLVRKEPFDDGLP